MYFDNYFTSPDLLVHLKKIGLKATGVVRKDRVKEKIILEKNATRGTFKVKQEKNSGMNFITLLDSKEVSLLSTCAGVHPLKDRKRYSKEKKAEEVIAMPNAFSNYNNFMGGVDLHDQYCSNLLPSFRSKKWTWPVLMRLIQSSVTNAVILSNAVKKYGKKKASKEFAMSIARYYLAKSKTGEMQSHRAEKSQKRKCCSNDACNTRTFFYCPTCNASFFQKCFENFHNK